MLLSIHEFKWRSAQCYVEATLFGGEGGAIIILVAHRVDAWLVSKTLSTSRALSFLFYYEITVRFCVVYPST